jgi:exodeoxyribonuclease VII large subunit
MDSPGSNIPEFAVGELAGEVKRTLEGAFGRIRVRGEVTEVKAYGPTRFYFSIKDTDSESKAKLNAVIWAWSAARTGLKPENGTEVVATGRLTAYSDRSSYQLTVERLEYAGAGAMLARIEALRTALLKEGLFDPGRKRSLPLLPRIVAVVTSAQGAVIQDIRTTIARRFPRPIQLWPVPVQGEGAAEKIAAALRAVSALPPDGPIPRPDVVILARGGGSLEDLMAFNEEAVVRAVAACSIPIISAIGHETDTTLADFAADRRAPTPTAAAEFAVPSRAELAADLAQRGARLAQAVLTRGREARLRLERAERSLPDLPSLLFTLRQRLDDRGERLRGALPGFVTAQRLRLAGAALPDPRAALRAARQALAAMETRRRTAWPHLILALRTRLAQAAQALPHPRERLAARRGALALLINRMKAAMRAGAAQARAAPALARLSGAPLAALLRERRARLEGFSQQLEALSHRNVLARGFALVTDASGAPVMRAASVRSGARLNLDFADGRVQAVADGSRRAAPRPAENPDQETLL